MVGSADAELVAFRVSEGGPLHVELVFVVNVRGTERDHSCHISGDVVGFKIEVCPVLDGLSFRYLDEHVSDPRRIAETNRNEER